MTSSFSSSNLDEYLQIDVEKAHLTKNKQKLGLGKMDPFVVVAYSDSKPITRTPTHWDAHFEPRWFHACPKIPLDFPKKQLTFGVYNDSRLGVINQSLIGQVTISVEELRNRANNLKASSLGLAAHLHLPLEGPAGTLVLAVKVKDCESVRFTPLVAGVDASWFESPVQRLGVSGGTAPFFSLLLTQKGQTETQQPSASYYIGKDLSHAEDEEEFYEEIRRIAQNEEEQQGVGLLVPFLFDYLGVLTTKTTDSEDDCQLLVMQNLRNQYKTFRMLDLKMGQQTAQGGWQGKSRFRAMKQNVLDGMTNSTLEGYRLEGFDGVPPRIDSMDPLLDLLAKEPGDDIDTLEEGSKTLLWGLKSVNEKDVKKAKRIMFQSFTGAEIFRYFMDVHLEGDATQDFNHYLPIEVAEIVLHELVSQLVHLATTCHQLQVPQKWIGSSVALGYDAGLFPPRDDAQKAHAAIRDKVIVNVFDWGRSELLTLQKYHRLNEEDQQDRHHFWENYKQGMDRLAFSATREYYHQFTNTTGWTELTLQVMDFDSLTSDDYIGKVTIPLPDPTDGEAIRKLQQGQTHPLLGTNGTPQGTITCSIAWWTLPDHSRLTGMWRVTVERANNLPIMDIVGPKAHHSSDPYTIVMARDASHYRQFQRATCVKAHNLNPIWNETIDVPVVRGSGVYNLQQAMEAKCIGIFGEDFRPEDKEFSKLLTFQENDGPDNISFWTRRLKKAAEGPVEPEASCAYYDD